MNYFRGGKCFIVQRKNTDIIKVFESDGIVITIEYKKYRHWLRENLAVDDDIFLPKTARFGDISFRRVITLLIQNNRTQWLTSGLWGELIAVMVVSH